MFNHMKPRDFVHDNETRPHTQARVSIVREALAQVIRRGADASEAHAGGGTGHAMDPGAPRCHQRVERRPRGDQLTPPALRAHGLTLGNLGYSAPLRVVHRGRRDRRLAEDTAGTIKAAAELHARAERPNLFIESPGTKAGLPAIEESIFAGVPVNVTFLFSREHYIAAAEAHMRGVERRVLAGRDPKIASVASVFVSRWDVAVKDKVPEALQGRLGIAVAMRTYKSYRELLGSSRWPKLAARGVLPQRLLWGSTGSKDPAARDDLYVSAFAAPDTIDTIPEKTLLAFADHGEVKGAMPIDGGVAEEVLLEFAAAGIDGDKLAADLQREGTASFGRSWKELMLRIASKRGSR